MSQTIKSTASFPEVARIRKGSAQTQKDGKTIIGKDLGQKLRIAFEPGNEVIAKRFEELHGGFLVDRIHAMIPFDLSMCWAHGYESYSSGGRVALVDDDTERYIMLRNPNTFDYEVLDGYPEKKYNRGDAIEYERNGRKIALAIKPFSRLKLFLPELERFVFVLLQSTSFYDRENLKGQLAAIQMIADSVNRGQVAGIPIFVYRMPRSVLWKSDTGAKRVEKWLLNIEIDPAWVGKATQRLGALAMNFAEQTPYLIEGTVNPDTDEDSEPEELLDTSVIEPNQESEVITEDVAFVGEVQLDTAKPVPVQLDSRLRAYIPMTITLAKKEKDSNGILYDSMEDDTLRERVNQIEAYLLANNLSSEQKEKTYLKRDAIVTILMSRQQDDEHTNF